eukprot:3262170-Rhodomonas_salina.1
MSISSHGLASSWALCNSGDVVARVNRNDWSREDWSREAGNKLQGRGRENLLRGLRSEWRIWMRRRTRRRGRGNPSREDRFETRGPNPGWKCTKGHPIISDANSGWRDGHGGLRSEWRIWMLVLRVITRCDQRSHGTNAHTPVSERLAGRCCRRAAAGRRAGEAPHALAPGAVLQ